jgi:hypothetical protein
MWMGGGEYKNTTGQALSGRSLAEKVVYLAEYVGWNASINPNATVSIVVPAPGPIGVQPIQYSTETAKNKALPLAYWFDGTDPGSTLSSLAALDTIYGFTIGQDKIALPGASISGTLATGALGGLAPADFQAKVNAMGRGYASAGLYQYAGDSYLLINDGDAVFDLGDDIVIKLAGVTAEQARWATIGNLFDLRSGTAPAMAAYTMARATSESDAVDFSDDTVDVYATTLGSDAAPAMRVFDFASISLAPEGKLALTINGATISYVNASTRSLGGMALTEAMTQDADFVDALLANGWSLSSFTIHDPYLSMQATRAGEQDADISLAYSSEAAVATIDLMEAIPGAPVAMDTPLPVHSTADDSDRQHIHLGQLALAPGGSLVIGERTVFTNDTDHALIPGETATGSMYDVHSENAAGVANLSWGEILREDGSIFEGVLFFTPAEPGGEPPTARYSSAPVAEVQRLVYDDFDWRLEPGQTLAVGEETYTHEEFPALSDLALAQKIADMAELQGWKVEVIVDDDGFVDDMLFISQRPGMDEPLLPISYTTRAVYNKRIEPRNEDNGDDAVAAMSTLDDMDTIIGFTIGQDKIWIPFDPHVLAGDLARGELSGLTVDDFAEKIREMEWLATPESKCRKSGLYQYEGDSYLLMTSEEPFDFDDNIVIKLAGVSAEEAAYATVENLFYTGDIA